MKNYRITEQRFLNLKKTVIRLYMIDPFTGVIDWKIEEPDLPLTGSLSYMIDGFGNMFLKGKYDVDVIKITMDGRVVN